MDRYDEVNAFVRCEINSEQQLFYLILYYFFPFTHTDTHVSIGGVVVDVFENAVGPLIDSSLQLATRE